MPTSAGDVTTTLFLNDPEAHKLSLEFVATTAVKAGQPVKLNSAEGVIPAAAGDLSHLIIGVALMDAAIGNLVTIAMKGYAVIFARSAAALNAGPVELGTYASGHNVFATSSAQTKTVGWSLDTAAAADEIIRVVISC